VREIFKDWKKLEDIDVSHMTLGEGFIIFYLIIDQTLDCLAKGFSKNL
jgi:hypothetical protein